MSKKRPHPDDTLLDSEIVIDPALIDDSSSEEPTSGTQPKADLTYGQRGAFPGLDDGYGDDELFYGPANDGLQYLRMVRHEAKGVPNLLVAPSAPEIVPQEALYADYPEGYYADGAYTAIPQSIERSTPRKFAEDEDQDPQEAYYASLCGRFTDLQATLHSAPSTSEADHTATLLRREKRAIWKGKILKTHPTMLTLSQLPQENIIYGLEILTELLTKRNIRIERYGRNLGAWAWGLLGKCRPVEEMGSEEVAVLRDLGKQGIWVMRRIVAGEVVEMDLDDNGTDNESKADEEEDDLVGSVEKGGEGDTAVHTANETGATEDRIDESVRVAQQRLLSALENGVPLIQSVKRNRTSAKHYNGCSTQNSLNGADAAEKNTSRRTSNVTAVATLDMIVTIIGELYGQRDLLEGRLLWDELQ